MCRWQAAMQTQTSFHGVAQVLCQESLKIVYLGKAVSIFTLFLHLLNKDF